MPTHIDEEEDSAPLHPPVKADDPVPRSAPLALKPLDWPVVRSIALPSLVPPPAADFTSVVMARRSDRSIRRASLRETANCLAFSTVPKARWGIDGRRTSRLAHSAGALHPIDILIVSGFSHRRVFRFEPRSRILQSLRIANGPALAELCGKLGDIFPEADCDYLVLLADFELAEAYYERSQTLVWRDAGALMQALHFCATAYRLAFCPAGILGFELAEVLFGPASRVSGVGVAAVGRPAAR